MARGWFDRCRVDGLGRRIRRARCHGRRGRGESQVGGRQSSDSLAVCIGDGSHHGGVGVRSVVAQDRRAQVIRAAQVTLSRAEVDRGCRSGVSHVLRVLNSVTIGVDTGIAPGAGQELHRANGPVVDGVPVEQAMVGVQDPRGPVRTIKRNADDARPGGSGRVQLVAAEAGVVALDPPDGSQQCPVDVAARVS